MIKYLLRLYHKVKLHWGIKKKIEPLFFNFLEKLRYHQHLMGMTVILPLYEYLTHLIFNRIVYHYGADYHWNDQKSQNLDKPTANLGYGLIHYAIVRNQKPKNILCVGSMYGFIPFALARACQDNQVGHVDFVDASFDIKNPNNKSNHTYGQGFWKKIKPKRHFSYLLDNSYITTHVSTVEQFLAKNPHKKYDYIYLDGDHRYQGGKRAVKVSWPRLNEEGYMCLHDIHFKVIAEGIIFGHWKVWQELAQSSSFKMEFSNHYSGLGIIQKITKPRNMFTHNFDQDPDYQKWRRGR